MIRGSSIHVRGDRSPSSRSISPARKKDDDEPMCMQRPIEALMRLQICSQHCTYGEIRCCYSIQLIKRPSVDMCWYSGGETTHRFISTASHRRSPFGPGAGDFQSKIRRPHRCVAGRNRHVCEKWERNLYVNIVYTHAYSNLSFLLQWWLKESYDGPEMLLSLTADAVFLFCLERIYFRKNGEGEKRSFSSASNIYNK